MVTWAEHYHRCAALGFSRPGDPRLDQGRPKARRHSWSCPATPPVKDQQAADLVVFHGSSTIDGAVGGSLTAFNAPVTITRRINGDVIAFNGRVELRSGATVTGDVVSRDAPVVASEATIGGTTRRVQANVRWDGFGWAGRLALWLAESVLTLALYEGLVRRFQLARHHRSRWLP